MKEFLLVSAIIFLALACASCGKQSSNEVVVYTALDETFSRPVLEEFEKTTGIKVRIQPDVEGSKTVGLVMKLISEENHPQADVFWNNEIGWTIVLKQKGILEKYTPESARDIPDKYKDSEGYWTGFAARVRVILFNTNLVKEEAAPQSVLDLTLPIYRGKVAIVRPLIGTTATHAAALFAALGDEGAKKFFLDLKANNCIIVEGNMIAAKMVANGEVAICLTDTDDANAMMLENKPVKMLYPDQAGMGALVLPNTIALIKNCPHPENAKKLIEYIVSAEIEQKLAKISSAQMPLRKNLTPYSKQFDLSTIKAMETPYEKIAEKLETAKEFINKEFVGK